MLSRRTAQTGKRVYRGTGHSPNRGQVSSAGAKGYIKRELRNKARAGVQRRVGGDGKSDNRSAVASRALHRKPNGPTKLGPKRVPPKKKPAPKPKPKPPNHTGTAPIEPEFQGDPKARTMDPNATLPQTQQVQVTKDGILQLPYDQAWGAEQLAAVTGANEELLGLKMEGDQQALEYGQGKRQSQLAFQSLQNQTRNANAASGTAFSSKYGTAVANNANTFANEMGDLEAANTGFQQNQNLQRNSIQTSLNQQLAALAQQQADALNEQAGSLGFGQNNQPLFTSNEGRIQAKKDAAAAKAKAAKAAAAKKAAAKKAAAKKAAARKRENQQDRKAKLRTQARNKLRRERQRKNKKGGKN